MPTSKTKQTTDLDVDLPFSQPVTFAHLKWQRCLAASHKKPLDIALLGLLYDTSASYRPRAGFGSQAIRARSAREKKGRSYNTVYGVDPYEEGLENIDCGGTSINPFVPHMPSSRWSRDTDRCCITRLPMGAPEDTLAL
ncbi:agmatinase [Penicillium canescens]|nr:agmatinase [Penicillium canescens]KAJ6076505.1 agmatinase [Penicillium canescens]KAJ6158813.1 agmatinase [Penicillium canescens]